MTVTVVTDHPVSLPDLFTLAFARAAVINFPGAVEAVGFKLGVLRGDSGLWGGAVVEADFPFA